MNRLMDGWIDEWMNRLMDGWIDEWIDKMKNGFSVRVNTFHSFTFCLC